MNVAAQKPRKLDIETFLAFYETRPDEEQWQLVDGVALLMTPPFILHQAIASNLQRLLNGAFEAAGRAFRAYQRIGIELPQFPHYLPEPDVAVIDLAFEPGRRYVDRFYLAAEAPSASDDERIDLKRGFYRAHASNRYVLLVSQERIEVEMDLRDGDGWRTEMLTGPDRMLRLPELGLTCRVGDLYVNTPLLAA